MKFGFEKYKNLLLLFSSCILFGADNSITAWFVFVPVFFLVEYVPLKRIWLYGGFYGILSYLFYASWLIRFSIYAAVGIYLLYFTLCALLFICMKYAEIILPKTAWLLWFIIICTYEYLKTKGFAGFNYGVNGYTQYKNIYLIQIADIFGIWGVSLPLNFFSSVIYKILHDKIHGKPFKNNFATLLILFAVIAAEYIYGFYRVNSTDKIEQTCSKIKIAAIQNNSDPWKSGLSSYYDEIKHLMNLTDSALNDNPDISLVVWPETAVVPSIMKNFYVRSDRERFEFVKNILEYIDKKNCAFLVGNFHVEGTGENSKDYNAALLFIPQKNTLPPKPQIYKKRHLVPFTEYFPYEKKFPHIYKLLLDGDTHLWDKGTEASVFNVNGLLFGTPICFEDTFGADCTDFMQNGAKAFINLSNDAWSKSRRCQIQHLKQAVFRNIENHVPSIRSTASGETCAIDSSGRIIKRCNPFTENYIIAEIPILNEKHKLTIYSKLKNIFMPNKYAYGFSPLFSKKT